MSDEWVRDRGAEIGRPNQGQLFFPLPMYPEVDFTCAHPSITPLAGKILGGWEHARHIELNCKQVRQLLTRLLRNSKQLLTVRGWEPGDSRGMSYHPDSAGPPGVLDKRALRRPYGPPDNLSVFIYLTDVDDNTPAFAVVPKSRRCSNIRELRRKLGDDRYTEIPILGPAGTAVLVDAVLVHTRLDPLVEPSRRRRLLHHVYARAGEIRNADGSLRMENVAMGVTKSLLSRGLANKRHVFSDDPE